ncbi:hypothetical protein UFOVP1262_7 [uncultured Caudovirales phage]|uniref:Uncharacterized protein n=1 Tax=uncultured Caudovirales phage TaxID=2100421 RepID=A0A6J5RPC0_9CAUD|nr:hypothetical protein UFOVP863_12 [uncultured Caudovirales phage]CAB4180227.1 hypothetical protein UFOVP1042_12 [uncultured Caudovirales phage]CAB4194115.1 hypothetical protein UFOVP1262_7 [uncultured Caudovirales phage]
MPNIVIDVAAEFTGKRAFDKAGKSASNLESTVGALGKKLALAFSAKAVFDFGKAAVKAFADDEKSAAILANTMKNLGLEFRNPAVEEFIKKLSAATGEVDDNLRPAMQKLLQVTGSVSESQKLMTLALDVAAGSGVDLQTVVSDLAAAHAGNTKGLKKYALGLTAAQLKTIKFEDVTDKLGKTFKGSAAQGAKTLAGQMKILATAAGEAQETIGGGLVEAFRILSGNNGITDITGKMEDFSQQVSDTVVGLALLIDKIKEIPIVGAGTNEFFKHWFDLAQLQFPGLKFATDAAKYLQHLAQTQTKPFQIGMSVTGATDYYDSIARKEAAALAKKLAADKKAAAAKLALDKKDAANKAILSKASAMFDLEKISIEAALKGKISDDEKLRLELQRAILNEDAALADTLQKRLEASQRATAALQGQITGITPPVDPFAQTLETLQSIATLLATISGTPFRLSTGNQSAILGDLNLPNDIIQPNPNLKPDPIPVIVADPIPEPIATNNPFAGLGSNTGGFGFSLPDYLKSAIPQIQPAPITVNVTNTGSVIMQDEFVQVISDAIVKVNTLGNKALRAGQVDVNAG